MRDQFDPGARERYIIGFTDANLHFFEMRTLAMCAPFLLPTCAPAWPRSTAAAAPAR